MVRATAVAAHAVILLERKLCRTRAHGVVWLAGWGCSEVWISEGSLSNPLSQLCHLKLRGPGRSLSRPWPIRHSSPRSSLCRGPGSLQCGTSGARSNASLPFCGHGAETGRCCLVVDILTASVGFSYQGWAGRNVFCQAQCSRQQQVHLGF